MEGKGKALKNITLVSPPMIYHPENTPWGDSPNLKGRRQKLEGRSKSCMYKSQRLYILPLFSFCLLSSTFFLILLASTRVTNSVAMKI